MATLTADEAARRLGVKLETVYAYVSRGVLQSRRRPGSRVSLFDAAEVEALARRGRPRRSTRPAALDFAIETHITSIGDHQLRFRGHDAARLARTATFEQAAELLWTGQLPGTDATWPPGPPAPSVSRGDEVPPDLGAVDRLRLAVVLASAADPMRGDLKETVVVERARSLVAAMVAALPVLGDGRVPRLALPGRPAPLRGTIAGRLWTRLAPGRPRPGMLTALNAALVLLADHELATSTFAARLAASTRADPYAVVLSGLGPVAGPLHGGASSAAREMLDDAALDGPERALAAALARHRVYPGFGHPVYPDGDPRAVVLLDLLRAAASGSPAMAVAEDMLAAARRRAHVEANVDFALAVLGAVAGMPQNAGEPIFTVARTAGWLAHALEEYGEAPLRFRPRAVYVR